MTVQTSPQDTLTGVRSGHVRGLLLQLVSELWHQTREAEQTESIPARLVEMLLELSGDPSRGVEDTPNYPEIQRRFIESVLRDPYLAEADILLGGQIFGIDFTRPRAVILVDARDSILAGERDAELAIDGEREQRRAKAVITSIVNYFSLPRDTICAYIGNGEVAILKASSSRDLAGWVEQQDNANWGTMSWANLSALKRAGEGLLQTLQRETRSEITIGIGRYHPGIRGLARSYQDARAALSLGVQYEGANQVHCLDRLGIASFVGVADQGTKIDLSAHLLSPLDHAPELIETLDAFFAENCCPSTCATRLAIHRNTLRYRLDKIASLTGLDPRVFDDAVQIRLALVVRLLRASSS
jgi:carbohydrate diacid regulator